MATSAQGADIGLVGLAVMGENLVLNMESHGFIVAVFNRTTSKVDAFTAGRAQGKKIVGTHSVQELVGSLKRPRKIMIMVKAGPAVDDVINELAPLLEPGDILIDGGNSEYQDSTRRTRDLKAKGLLFIGTGVSGGEEGALRRRGRRAEGPVDHARRQSRGLAARQADFPGHRRQGRRRHPLLRLGRPRGRRALRQDGAQRHRVRRHAAHLRGVLRHARTAGHGARRDP
jgi:6-phosphogluconate dehydrogenase (decarboxylating)